MSRPQRVPRAQLREEILRAAGQILSREGAEGLTARAVAREVGYTAASIYNVFGSMSDLLMELNRDTLLRLEELFAQLPDAAGPAEKLHHLTAAYIAFMQQNPALWQAIFGGVRQREQFPDWYVAAIAGLKQKLAGLLGQYAPGLSAERADHLAEQLYVAVHGAVALDLERRLDLLTRQSAVSVAAAVLDMILLSLRSAS